MHLMQVLTMEHPDPFVRKVNNKHNLMLPGWEYETHEHGLLGVSVLALADR